MNHPGSQPNPRLAGLDPEHLQVLLGLSRLVEFAPGEHVFREGDLAHRLWLVQDGRVLLHTYVPGRGEVPIETLGVGDVLGWSWLTAPYRWQFTATAMSQARAREIDAAILHESSAADPVFGYAVVRALSGALVDRLQATRARLLDLYGEPDPVPRQTNPAAR
ncbi:Crp/Fnr family transcriptional regulator [Rhodococcus oryzae]|uniref:Crp/Fnr family transcriptional regulator n=1 Tax=Rhodococcus oryzae TaxID=2571143 RepID=UPI0037A178A3